MRGVSVIDRFLEVFAFYIASRFGLLGGDVAFLPTTLIVIDITLARIVFDGFAGLSLVATGGPLSAAERLQPGRIAQPGLEAGQPILEPLGELSDLCCRRIHFSCGALKRNRPFGDLIGELGRHTVDGWA